MVQSAVGYFPPSLADPYDSWLNVGMALHDWDSTRGLDLWHEFSRQSAKYDAAVLEAKWSRFTQGGGLTVGSNFHTARENGWEPPWKRTARAGSGVGNGRASSSEGGFAGSAGSPGEESPSFGASASLDGDLLPVPALIPS